jgi:hypothetical protein
MKLLALVSLVSLSAVPAIAAETSIEMLNSKDGENLVFSRNSPRSRRAIPLPSRPPSPATMPNSFLADFRKGPTSCTAKSARTFHTLSTRKAFISFDAPHTMGWAWLHWSRSMLPRTSTRSSFYQQRWPAIFGGIN